MSNTCDCFKQDELLEIFQDLIQIKSENPLHTEEKMALYIKELFEQENIETKLSWAKPDRPNVIAKIKGEKPGPTLLYNGHLDVVPVGDGWSVDPYKAEIVNGRLYGRGAADMKSGVAAMLYAAISLKRIGSPFQGDLILVFNVDEERENIGIKHFLEEDITVDYSVIGEPTELDICIGHKGVSRYQLFTKGTSSHAAATATPDNAIYKMTKLVTALEQLGTNIARKIDTLLGSASLTVTKIQGGKAANMIPGQCVIEIDRRSLPGETSKSISEEISEAIKEVAYNYNFDFDLENYLFIPATSIESRHAVVQNLIHSAKKQTDREIKVKNFEATCEAPFFSNQGIPTVIFGPGSLEQAHVVDEFVEIQQVIDASRTFIDLALQILTTEEV